MCRLSPALSPSLLGGQHGSRGEKERERERERYAIMVLNRQGLDNFVLELKSVGDVELAEEFVIVQDGPQVVGLWIFQEPEPASTAGKRAEVERIIRQCARRAEWTGGEEKDEMAGNGYGDSESDDAASAVVVVQTTHTTTQPISPSAQTRHSSSGHDILGELFRKASKNYHGS